MSTLSPLGLGAASLGNLYREVDEDQAWAALTAAWDSGIRYFDTAPHYGLGLSERRLGAFLQTKPREDFVLSTKVGRVLVPNPTFAGGRDMAEQFDVPDDLVRVFDPTLDGVRRSIDDSLARLGLDRIDIAYLHDPDVYDLDRGLGEGLPALETVRAEGVVGRIGVGVNDAAAAARAVREGNLDVVMVAGRYTLVDDSALAELFPAAAERNTRIVVAAPFNSGLLATPRPGTRFNYADAAPELVQRAHAIADVAEDFGTDLPTLALHYPLRHTQVDSVVAGSANPDAIRQNAQRLSREVPDILWNTLTERGLIAREVFA